MMAFCVSAQFIGQFFGASDLTTLAGLPATMASGGTSRVTTLPAPIIAFSPTVIPHSSTAPEPMDAPRLTKVGMQDQSASVCNFPSAGGAGITVVGESDVVTDENLVLQSNPFANESVAGDFTAVPDFGPLLDLHERADLHVVPNLATVKIDETNEPDIFAQPDIGRNPQA